MSRTPVIKTKKQNYSPNLKSADSLIPQQKKIVIGKKNNNLTNFWRLIIITSVVFCFGGLGFGMALRYGKILDNSQSFSLQDNSKNLLNKNW